MKRSPLRRKKRMRRCNPERRKRKHVETFGPQARLARLLICAVPRCTQPAEPAHVRSRGAGGKDKDVANLCRWHHREQHDHGLRTFEDKHGISLEVVAGRLEELVRDHECVAWLRDGACAVCLAPAKELEGPA